MVYTHEHNDNFIRIEGLIAMCDDVILLTLTITFRLSLSGIAYIGREGDEVLSAVTVPSEPLAISTEGTSSRVGVHGVDWEGEECGAS